MAFLPRGTRDVFFFSAARRTGGDEENTPFHPYSPYAFAKQLKKNKLYVVVLYVRV